MAAANTIVVIKTGASHPIDGLFGALRDDADTELAVPEPVDPDEGLRLLKARHDIAVVLLLSSEADIPPIVERIRAASASVHIVALAVETGTTRLTLRDPNYEELTRVIHALCQAPGVESQSAKPLRWRARTPAATPQAGSRTLPVPVVDQVAPEALAQLDAGLAWVETATGTLLEIWSDREETPGFALSWQALERWLEKLVHIFDSPADAAERRFRAFMERIESDVGATTPLAQLAALLDRDPLALKLLLIALAGDLDIRFHRLFGALHDDFGRRHPSLVLACAIVAVATEGATPLGVRAELAALRRLRELGLIEGIGPVIGVADQPLRATPTLVDWLLTENPRRLIDAHAARLQRPVPHDSIELLPEARMRRLRRAMRQALAGRNDDETRAVMLTGSAPGWLQAEAAALGEPALLVAPPAVEMAPDDLDAALRTLITAARLSKRRLVVDLDGDDAATAPLWNALTGLLGQCERPPFVLSSNPAGRLGTIANDGVIVVTLPPPENEERTQAVAAVLAQQGQDDDALARRIGEGFPVAIDRMPDAHELALSAAAARGHLGSPEPRDWLAGFRRAAGARLPSLARRIEPKPCPGDEPFSCLDAVVVPETQRDQLEELVKHVRYGRIVLDEWGYRDLVDGQGVAALFAGDSGTGKTTAAHAVASQLDTDLYAIELAQIVSKYIGETEKNLDIVFDEAERAGAVLLFDEADALFGKRSAVSDAHDRYANIEVAYLLQRMQRFQGLAILTTNNSENIDPAFTRRLRFRIDFPRPSAADRLAIWEQSIPEERRAEWLNLRRIALALEVTGGIIRQMALHAAVMAAEEGGKIRFAHVIAGARSQLIRLGRFGELPKLDAIARDPEARAA